MAGGIEHDWWVVPARHGNGFTGWYSAPGHGVRQLKIEGTRAAKMFATEQQAMAAASSAYRRAVNGNPPERGRTQVFKILGAGRNRRAIATGRA